MFEKETGEGSTVGDVIKQLAAEHQAFKEAVFDPETNRISELVAVALNDRLVEALQGLDTQLKDGDIIGFFPVIAGG